MGRGTSKAGGNTGGSTKWFNTVTSKDIEYDEPVLKAGKASLYSRQIFDRNYRDAKTLAKQRGDDLTMFEMGDLYWKDDQPTISKVALKGVQSLINTEKDSIRIDLKLGVIDDNTAKIEKIALNAVQRTLNKQAKW